MKSLTPALALLALFCAWQLTWAAAADHAATNQLRPWLEYRTIMWVGDTASKKPDKLPLFYQRLREMGINTGMVYGDGNMRPLLDNQFPFYVENLINKGLCLKFNSQVRDWDKFVTTWTKNGRPESAFVRDYCLDDPQWRAWACGEMQRLVRKYRPHDPLAYDIRDELSTTISANPFDYDFNPITLEKFREWLKTQYRPLTRPSSTLPMNLPFGTVGTDSTPSVTSPEKMGTRWNASLPGSGAQGASECRGILSPSEGERDTVRGPASDAAALDALNNEWETKFTSWNEVRPFTTDQIKNRMASGDALPRGTPDWQALQRLKFDPVKARQQPTRWNFSPWCDFRTYMDISLADALNELRQAAHALDPRTPVGIEGTQMPDAFGGYDLWRLSQVLDWVEPYDIGNAREIFGSFMPGKPMVTTVFEKDTHHARRRLWHLLLEGDRGCIIWWSEDCIDWKSDDYALTPKAQALAPVLKEMTSPLAQLFLRAEREYDPVFILYSQPSIQVDWLLESTVDGSTWHRRFSSFEADYNRLAKVRNGWLKAFTDLGHSPKFISSDELARGAQRGITPAVLVLPQCYALSEKEAEGVAACLRSVPTNRETVRFAFADGTPGLFDEHGRLRPTSPLEPFFPTAVSQDTAYVANSAVSLGGHPTEERAGDMAKLAVERLQPTPDKSCWEWIAKHAFAPPVRLPAEARTRIHRFRLGGGVRLLAFERNIDYHMSEDLKQAGGNEHLETPIELEARLAQPEHVYDLRTQKYLGQTDRIAFRLDPWQPSLFALLPEKVPAETIVAKLLSAR